MDLSQARTVLTRKGYEELQQELDEIMQVKRPAIISRIKNALAAGDLRENFDYHDAKRQQGMIEGRIMELKAILNSATVVDCTGEDGCIGVGSVVCLRDMDDGFECTYTIVGPAEADPSDGKISYESNVGAALMDRRQGEIVSVQASGGEFKYEIVSVE